MAIEWLADLAAEPALPSREVRKRIAAEPHVDLAELLAEAEALGRQERRSYPHLSEVIVEAVLEVAGSGDQALLRGFVEREDLPPHLRVAVAAAARRLGHASEEWLSLDEPGALSLVVEILRQPHDAVLRGDPGAWIQQYQDATPALRRNIPALVAHAVDRGLLEGPAAALLAPLFGAEMDPELRIELVEVVSVIPEPVSAAVLVEWQALAGRRPERQAIRRGLDRLQAQGIDVSDRMPGTRISSWVTGCDGAGSYHVAICVESGRGLGITLLYVLNTELGIREAQLLPLTQAGLVSSVGDALPVSLAAIPAAEAVGRVREGLQQLEVLGRPAPPGFEDTRAWLEKVPTLSLVRPSAGPRVSEPSSDLDADGALEFGSALAQEPEFEGWYLVPNPEALARIEWRILTQVDEDEDAECLAVCARVLTEAVDTRPRREQLARMLRHQAGVFRAAGFGDWALCADETASRLPHTALADLPFGRVLLEDSLRHVFDVIEEVDRLLPSGEAREALRDALEPARQAQRGDVVRLDFGELMLEELVRSMAALAPEERLGRAEALNAARACAGILIESLAVGRPPGVAPPFTADRTELLAQGLRGALAETSVRAQSQRLSRVLAVRAASFANLVCHARCPHSCLSRLDDDGEALFYAAGHPSTAASELPRHA